MAMLKGHIEVWQYPRIPGHGLDQLVRDVAGIGVHYANPGYLWGGDDDLVKQMAEPILHAQIVAVISGIL